MLLVAEPPLRERLPPRPVQGRGGDLPGSGGAGLHDHDEAFGCRGHRTGEHRSGLGAGQREGDIRRFEREDRGKGTRAFMREITG